MAGDRRVAPVYTASASFADLPVVEHRDRGPSLIAAANALEGEEARAVASTLEAFVPSAGLQRTDRVFSAGPRSGLPQGSDAPKQAVMSDFLYTTLLGKRVHRVGISNNYGIDADGLRKAFDRGLNYVWYVRGTEKVATAPIREACARDRDRVFIATGPSMGFTGGAVRKHCDKVLTKLGTDHVDLLQLFWAGKMSRISDGTLTALTKLRDEGKCRGIGVSIHDRPWAGQLARDRVFDVLMVRYNAGHPGAEEDIFPHVGEGAAKVGVVSYTSTRWGTLLKKPSRWQDRPATAAECYNFALTHPAVDVVLTGPASWGQLEANLEGLEAPMDAERLAWMKELGAKARGSNPITGYFAEGF